MKKTTILIVDDHAIFRRGLASLLNTVNEFCVTGEAEDGKIAIRRVDELNPDIVIMDLLMPVKDGTTATVEILQKHPQTKIVILTTFGSFNGLAAALKAGAVGALLKNIDNDELVRSLQNIANGKTVISPEIRQILREDPPTPELSRRQQEILDLLVKGRTNGEIAAQLALQEDSIKKVVNAIFEKIGARNRAEAVAIALRKHLLKI